MKIKYTDNHGKTKYLEVPDDTQESVLEFLDESEHAMDSQRRKDKYQLEHLELSDEELFIHAVHKPPEVIDLLERASEEPKQIKNILKFIREKCTEKQKRRFYFYVLYNLPLKTIAHMEGCSIVAVWKSIHAAALKLTKYS